MRIFGFLDMGEAGGQPLALSCALSGQSAQCSKSSSWKKWRCFYKDWNCQKLLFRRPKVFACLTSTKMIDSISFHVGIMPSSCKSHWLWGFIQGHTDDLENRLRCRNVNLVEWLESMSKGEKNAFFLEWIMKVLGIRGSDFYLQYVFSHCILRRGNKVSIGSICLSRELIYSS